MGAVRLVGVVCLLGSMVLTHQSSHSMARYEYHYSVRRNLLEEEEEKNLAGIQWTPNENETIVSNYLEYLKWKEFNATKDAFRPSKPIEDVLPQIKQSKVYKVLRKFPKGGNLHIHQHHILPKSKMLQIIFDNPDLKDKLCVNQIDSTLNFFYPCPSGWSPASNYSKEELLKNLTFINILPEVAHDNPTDSALRWKYMSPIFKRAGKEVVMFQNYTRLHIQALLKHALDENVQYLEARASGNGMYVLDSEGGHMNIDNEDGDLWFRTLAEEVDKFIETNSNFIGYKEIIQISRDSNRTIISEGIERAIRLRENHSDMVSGFDLVGEEDPGHTLLFHIEEFAEIASKNQELPLYFHTAESNWPKDLPTSQFPDDRGTTMGNMYEAIVLGSKRVGHGIGFIKHPHLMQILKQHNIAVELNPVSNMLLGYVTDQRHHPGLTYFRDGIPVVIASDDPGTMGFDEVTVDWYEAFMAWGLQLSDMRTIAMNSIMYSTMSDSEKKTAMAKYEKAWSEFISIMKSDACSAVPSFAEEPKIYSIYPSGGPVSAGTKVRVFGENFHRTICNNITCIFGDMNATGKYVYNHMIICEAPPRVTGEITVNFSVMINTKTIIGPKTHLTFQYLDITPEPSSANVVLTPDTRLTFLILMFIVLNSTV